MPDTPVVVSDVVVDTAVRQDVQLVAPGVAEAQVRVAALGAAGDHDAAVAALSQVEYAVEGRGPQPVKGRAVPIGPAGAVPRGGPPKTRLAEQRTRLLLM